MATDVSVQFAKSTPKPTPPDYPAIKLASDAKIKAAEDACTARGGHVEHWTCILPPPPAPKPVVVVYASTSVDTSDPKMFIYMMESGNRTNAINASSGACGLGQALPCSKMPCSLDDYPCQDAWFTSYMQGRYGSWANAKAFWVAHRWW